MRIENSAAERGARPKRGLGSLIALPLIAFLLGLAAMGWLLARWDGAAARLGVRSEAAAPLAEAPPLAVTMTEEPIPQAGLPPEQQTQRLVIDPETTRRVNRLEERIAQVDNQSRAAVGNADRAEGLLVAFAARRAIDRGVSLGYIEGLLRQRFGERQPQAVATIITASRQSGSFAPPKSGIGSSSPPGVSR